MKSSSKRIIYDGKQSTKLKHFKDSVHETSKFDYPFPSLHYLSTSCILLGFFSLLYTKIQPELSFTQKLKRLVSRRRFRSQES